MSAASLDDAGEPAKPPAEKNVSADLPGGAASAREEAETPAGEPAKPPVEEHVNADLLLGASAARADAEAAVGSCEVKHPLEATHQEQDKGQAIASAAQVAPSKSELEKALREKQKALLQLKIAQQAKQLELMKRKAKQVKHADETAIEAAGDALGTVALAAANQGSTDWVDAPTSATATRAWIAGEGAKRVCVGRPIKAPSEPGSPSAPMGSAHASAIKSAPSKPRPKEAAHMASKPSWPGPELVLRNDDIPVPTTDGEDKGPFSQTSRPQSKQSLKTLMAEKEKQLQQLRVSMQAKAVASSEPTRQAPPKLTTSINKVATALLVQLHDGELQEKRTKLAEMIAKRRRLSGAEEPSSDKSAAACASAPQTASVASTQIAGQRPQSSGAPRALAPELPRPGRQKLEHGGAAAENDKVVRVAVAEAPQEVPAAAPVARAAPPNLEQAAQDEDLVSIDSDENDDDDGPVRTVGRCPGTKALARGKGFPKAVQTTRDSTAPIRLTGDRPLAERLMQAVLSRPQKGSDPLKAVEKPPPKRQSQSQIVITDVDLEDDVL